MKRSGKGKKKGIPWSRSSDRPPPEPTAGSKTLLFAPLLGSQPHQSLSVKKDGLRWHIDCPERSKDSPESKKTLKFSSAIFKSMKRTSAEDGCRYFEADFI